MFVFSYNEVYAGFDVCKTCFASYCVYKKQHTDLLLLGCIFCLLALTTVTSCVCLDHCVLSVHHNPLKHFHRDKDLDLCHKEMYQSYEALPTHKIP